MSGVRIIDEMVFTRSSNNLDSSFIRLTARLKISHKTGRNFADEFDEFLIDDNDSARRNFDRIPSAGVYVLTRSNEVGSAKF